MYSILRKTVEANIESELKNSVAGILNMVKTSVSVSIKNHLRAVAEKNLEIVEHIYNQYKKGEISEEEAKKRATGIILCQKIGTTGYIACVSSKGVLLIHPQKSFVGVDISSRAFVREMMRKKEGYIEYYWKNPGDDKPRPKAMYIIYFKPWDWIITVSSYRKEFNKLVNVDDFRKSVLAIKFGKTGYSYVADIHGNIIIHPKLQGVNILKDKSMPNQFFKTMIKKKNGKIVYSWKNPKEPMARKKLVFFNYIPEYEWIVASSSYMDEFYSPLDTIGNVIIFTLTASMFLVLPMSFFISSSITNPLNELISRMELAAAGDLSVRAHRKSLDEIGQLASYFNTFMDKLEAYNKSLRQEISERKQAQEALTASEEKYRSVMEATPDPIVVYDMNGRVLYINPAFSDVFGWTPDECMGKKMDRFVPEDTWEETKKGLKVIAAGKRLSSVETRRFTKDGRTIDVSISGAVYKGRNGTLAGSVIIHRDISEVKRLEKKIMDIGDRERQKIGADLHDDLCPHLIGIEGLTKVLKHKLEKKAPKESELLSEITMLIKEAIGKTRQLARGLCPVYLVDYGLESSLRELAVKTENLYDIKCEFQCTDSLPISDNTAATHIFHIAQEAVHNAIRHGKADHIIIQMSVADDRGMLKIIDNGIGLPEIIKSDGMGLRIMDFRAKMIKASLGMRRGETGGTIVEILFG